MEYFSVYLILCFAVYLKSEEDTPSPMHYRVYYSTITSTLVPDASLAVTFIERSYLTDVELEPRRSDAVIVGS